MLEPNFDKSPDGLLPAVAQDVASGEILMLAYVNREAWKETLDSGCATYWSRSRGKLWKKGETSGNVQRVHEILLDCDADAIVFKVEQLGGAACHTGYRSCFYRKVADDKESLECVGELVCDPEELYGGKTV
ncbi:MAG: phosphoribosyl-AMP cyclohydrolase [Victivallales bacterium]|nr:phosphoribosyl-AMP cyclohydrolase [Victivallales bacterium]